MTKKKTIKYIVFGAIGGLVADILLNLAGMDVYNIFYTPLNRLIPIDAVVPVVFILAGIIFGYVYSRN
jgi:hypothetical protein